MRTKNIILIIITIAIGILTVMFIGSLGMSFGMQKSPEPIELPKKFDSLNNQVEKKYKLDGFSSIYNNKGTGFISKEELEQNKRKKIKQII